MVILAYSFQAVAEFKRGKVEYRADKTGIVHIPFGKVDFPEEDLFVNFLAAVVCDLHPIIVLVFIKCWVFC